MSNRAKRNYFFILVLLMVSVIIANIIDIVRTIHLDNNIVLKKSILSHASPYRTQIKEKAKE